MLTQLPNDERSGLERLFGQKIVRLATAWRREIDLELRPFGMSDATWRPVFYLAVLPPPVNQTELARAMSIEAPSLARLMEVLERRDLITRTTDSADRRSKVVALTPRGIEVGRDVLAAVQAVASRLLAGLTIEELRLCVSLFDRVDGAIRVPAPRVSDGGMLHGVTSDEDAPDDGMLDITTAFGIRSVK